MQLKLYLYLLLLTTFTWLSCESQRTSESVASKKLHQTDLEFPAFNRELLINIEGDSIASYALIASGHTAKETVILLAGYPGNDNNFDIAQEIRRQGRNVILFNHRGAWGSQGVYSYFNCLEDVEFLVNYFSKEEISAELRVDQDSFILLGRSFGGGIAIISGGKIDAVKKIIAISSVNYGSVMKKYSRLDELSGFKNYMKKQIMMNHDIDYFLQELLDRKNEIDLANYNEDIENKNVLLIEDSSKNQDWINQLEHAESVILESDHNFIDKRIELTNLIVEWLDQT